MNPTIWRGTVTRMLAGRPCVEVERFAKGFEFRNVDSLLAGLVAGDKVLVAFVEGRNDEIVVLGRIVVP